MIIMIKYYFIVSFTVFFLGNISNNHSQSLYFNSRLAKRVGDWGELGLAKALGAVTGDASAILLKSEEKCRV